MTTATIGPFARRAQERWPNAVWINGEGPYASVSFCHDYPAGSGYEDDCTTVELHSTLREAEEAKARIDQMACGGGCTRHHMVARLVPSVRQRFDEPPTEEPYSLYRYFDACGCLLYVGITDNLARRDGEHRRNSPWHALAVRREVAGMAGKEYAEDAERQAVHDEHPAFNSALRDSRSTNEALTRYLLSHAGKQAAVRRHASKHPTRRTT